MLLYTIILSLLSSFPITLDVVIRTVAWWPRLASSFPSPSPIPPLILLLIEMLWILIVFASFLEYTAAFIPIDFSVASNKQLTIQCSDSCGDGDSITFVSSNILKIEEVKSILGTEFPFQLRFEGLDLEEPQATPIEISQAKCRNACELVNGPIIVEDTSLCFNALNGLPGQYIKWFYEAIGNEGLEKLLAGFEDRSAYAECVLSFSLGKGFPVRTFVGIAEGKANHFKNCMHILNHNSLITLLKYTRS